MANTPACHVVVTELIFSLCLGTIHGGIGLTQQRIGIRGIFGKMADADAGTDMGSLPFQLKGDGQGIQQIAGYESSIISAVYLLQKDGEFIAAQACHHVAFPHMLTQSAGHRLQQDITQGVPQGVIDRLETVEIEKQQGQIFLVSMGFG